MKYQTSHRGFVLAWVCVLLIAIIAVIGLSIDTMHVAMAAQKLQIGADAGALAAADQIISNPSNAQNAAIDVAHSNTVAQAPIQLSTSNVVIGRYRRSTKVFTPTNTNPNAAKVTAPRTAGSLNGSLPLLFGPAFGVSNVDIQRSAVAIASPPVPAGIIAYNGATLKNNFFFGVYNSKTTTTPSQGSSQSNGSFGSNGLIDGKNNNTVHGDILLGNTGKTNGITPSGGGSVVQLPGLIPMVPMPTWAPVANPNGVPQVYTVSSATVLPGGEYWFTQLNILADLSFSADAIVYVNGNIVINASLTAQNRIPSNLQVYQLGTGRTFAPNSSAGSNHIDIIADVWAPGSTYDAKNNSSFMGRGYFDTITSVKNNAEFWYDSNLTAKHGAFLVQ